MTPPADTPATAADPAPTKEQVQESLTFWEFFETFVALNELQLPLKPQHKAICDALELAVLGQLGKKYIIINMPPRVGKTKICEALAAWMLAYYSDSQLIYTSYANNLACESVRYIQGVIGSQWYQELFPATKLGRVRQADHFTTAGGGNVFGDGVGGSLTGRGAGLKRVAGGFIVIDDPAKPTEAMSKVEGEALRFWFENTLLSRRNSSEHCPVIICAQRLASDDLPGYVMENYAEDFIQLKFPGLDEAGNSTIPETRSTEDIKKIEKTNPFVFSAQYQQEPVMLKGNLIKDDWFKYHDFQTDDEHWEEKIITCDAAVKAEQHNDNWVFQAWGRREGNAYLLDEVCDKMDMPTAVGVALSIYAKHNLNNSPIGRFLIEEAASGVALMQTLQRGMIPAQGIKRIKDKVARVKDVLAFPATGRVFWPKKAPWLPAHKLELMAFREDGLAAKDDRVDAWTDGIRELIGASLSILDVIGKLRRR